MNKIPSRLPIAQRWYVFDKDPSVGLVSKRRLKNTFLAFDLGTLATWIVEYLAITATKDVETLPGEHLEVA